MLCWGPTDFAGTRYPGRVMDDDKAEIDETARQYLSAHGRAAVALLIELAEIDAAAGDELSARTWRERSPRLRNAFLERNRPARGDTPMRLTYLFAP